MVIIIPKGAAVILQVSENTARKKLRDLRNHYSLLPHQKICVKKFCEYFALDEELVVKNLKLYGK